MQKKALRHTATQPPIHPRHVSSRFAAPYSPTPERDVIMLTYHKVQIEKPEANNVLHKHEKVKLYMLSQNFRAQKVSTNNSID